MKRSGIALSLGMLGSVISYSSEAREEIILDDIVVTGTRTETSVKDSPVTISVIDAEDLAKSNDNSVAEILRDVPGITIDDSSIAGLKRLKIRGEAARRGGVLIDGQEITDHTSYGSPILIDPELIERIEVVRGPQSVLYGSKAISGVINIITKKGGDRPLQGTVSSSYNSASNGTTVNALMRGAQDGWEYRLFTGHTKENNRETPSGELSNTGTDNQSFSGYLGYGWDNQKIGVSVDKYELSSGSYISPSTLGTAFSKFDLDMPQRDLQKFAATYDIDNPFDVVSKIHFDTYHQTIDRKFTQNVASGPLIPPLMSYDYSHVDQDTQKTFGFLGQIDWMPHPDHDLITGVQYLRDDLDKSLTRTGTQGILATPVDTYADMEAHMTTTSVYAQDTWYLPSDFALAAGARHYWIESELDELDSNDSGFSLQSGSDDATVGSLTLTYTGLPSTTLRAGYSQGYVYPTLLQSYTGTYFGASSTTRPNPDLKAETSDNFEIGVRYENANFLVDAALFRSQSEDYIASAQCSDVVSVGCSTGESTYVNIDESKAYGAELALEYTIPNTEWTPYVSGSYLRRSYKYRNTDTYETGSPDLSGRFGLRHEKRLWNTVNLTSDLYVRASSRSDEVSESSSGRLSTTQVPGWQTYNLSFNAHFDTFRVGLDLLNLADHAYQTNPDEMEQPGRSFILKVEADF
ncbi:TonB-dependent receptor plug domain-containing protein [Thalassospira xiamenensis]|uniref:TonB-dependent receptor plug domain-containing protein n=1 Tax=Thalassospira xiamenensis TaxID=220697 RepID=UPI0009ED6B1A|nr:TonB-dependent receptor [Thalassospira xiamenensis]MCK2167203.1 TonB-dependent receptor [Thalassospira xiamenensis]